MKNIIIANFSINSIALIEWARNNLKEDFCVLSVNTGFQANNWDEYLQEVFNWLEEQQIKYFHLTAENDFSTLVRARKQFPSQQFSWCAGFLKGITLLNKIDELDPDCEATILLPHRKDLSKASALLKEHIEEEEKYDYRSVWYPLINLSKKDIENITKDLFFCQQIEKSLECQPCIHITRNEASKIATKDIKKVIELEDEIKSYMFGDQTLDTILKSDFFKKNNNILEELSKACSWEYSCGL